MSPSRARRAYLSGSSPLEGESESVSAVIVVVIAIVVIVVIANKD